MKEAAHVNLFAHAVDAWRTPSDGRRISTRALWALPEPNESGAPERRIIHSRAVFADAPLRLDRLQLAPSTGYFKDGSADEDDAPLHVRLSVPAAGDWDLVGEIVATSEQVRRGAAVLDLEGRLSTSVVAEVRRAEVDRWWPGWNHQAGSCSRARRPGQRLPRRPICCP